MNQVARRIGRTLALVLPVVLVLSGTLAVTYVPWSTPSGTRMLTTSAERATPENRPLAPHEVLRDRLVAELRQEDPGAALTSLQKELNRKPSLAEHCVSIAKALGRAAVEKYGAVRAHSYSRPVCDTSFAAGVAAAR
ncbi:hypothetical protein F0L17_11135 [Streptomyces sp. TRM43335]|uniref:Uncharacterized protein n=1 Tax=Streptomyces taklimakanensis TaxID=2569853 RepID=A0A6G2BBL7_9ACTN|nr:hypothetical protein [Streptomyces taklimakanensis]